MDIHGDVERACYMAYLSSYQDTADISHKDIADIRARAAAAIGVYSREQKALPLSWEKLVEVVKELVGPETPWPPPLR
jgi:hypothetical protein